MGSLEDIAHQFKMKTLHISQKGNHIDSVEKAMLGLQDEMDK